MSRQKAAGLLLLLAASCTASGRQAAHQTQPPPAPISVEWTDASLAKNLGRGFSLRRCADSAAILCVDLEGRQVGSIAIKDLPTLGEEKTSSADQVRAVLAGRINSLYEFDAGRWRHACGDAFRVESVRPRALEVGGTGGMRYEMEGRAAGKAVERVVGYWTYRNGIETVIEARAAAPGRCEAEALGQIAGSTPDQPPVFTPETLRRFEPFLDRIAGGSRLPPETLFSEQSPGPGG